MHYVTVKKSKKSSDFDSDLFIFYRQCIYSNQKRCKIPNKVCEKGTIFNSEIYERGAFSAKSGI